MTGEKDSADPKLNPKPKAQQRIGLLKQTIRVPDDFDTMDQAEIEAMFYGSDEDTP